MVKLTILGGETRNFEDLEEKTIALDGVVQGPRIDHKNQRYSFDHHGTVQRLCTTSTAKQVLDALILGFNPEEYNLLINHADLDSVLSVYLLQNPQLAKNPFIINLVRDLNDFDVHGPMYPIEQKETIDWLEQPFKEVKKQNQANKVRSLRKAFNETTRRLKETIANQPTFQQDDCLVVSNGTFEGYKLEYVGEGGWVLARRVNRGKEPEDYDPISELYKKGFDKIILYEDFGDRRKFTVCKRSDFIDFPVGPGTEPDTILFALDDIEKGWGGGSTVGGSPRETAGSELEPKTVCRVADNAVIKSKKKKKPLVTDNNIILMVNDASETLPVPEKVLRNIGLAFALEPIPDKRGCTTRYRDLKPTITLEMFTSAAINSSIAYLHLSRYCLEHQTIEGSYQFLLEAMRLSKWARGGGKVNQGMLEFTVPIIATQMLIDPQAKKDPYELLEQTTQRLNETTRKDVRFLIEAKRLGNILSNVETKYPVNEHPRAKDVLEYYENELRVAKKGEQGTSIVHNAQFVNGFKDVAIMLEAFTNSRNPRFSERVNDAYETMLGKQEINPLGKGLAADLVATMLYLSFAYSHGDMIVK